MSWALPWTLPEAECRWGLSARLSCVADLIGARPFVDVGTDHARLPVALVADGHVSRARGAELNEAPLVNAERTVRKAGVEDRVELTLGDGLQEAVVQGFDTAVVAGMGGRTIAAMIAQSPKLPKALVLQPNDRLLVVREALRKRAYTLTEERWVVDTGRLFLVMRAERGTADWGPAATYLGPLLVGRADVRSWCYLELQRRHLLRKLRDPEADFQTLQRLAWVRSEQPEHPPPGPESGRPM